MRKKVEKRYPVYHDTKFKAEGAVDVQFFNENELGSLVPNRFEFVYTGYTVVPDRQNFVAFSSKVLFPRTNKEPQLENTPFYIYNDPIELTSVDQLKGEVGEGAIDFFNLNKER